MSSKPKKWKGPDKPKRRVVLPGKKKIVRVEDKTNKDYDQFDGYFLDLSILLSNEDNSYLHDDHKEGTFVMTKHAT
uniref:Uncharacterized protein n=1 Tax=Oryza punctata TaxID=4537 RepID=A0A0E0M5S2_ORYPU